MIFSGFTALFEKLTLQTQVSNIRTALACSSIDNPVMFFFGLFTQCTFKCKCFQKSKFIARNTRAGNQKRDMPIRLTAPETLWCVYFLQSTDNDV